MRVAATPIRIAVVDDHEAVRAGLERVLDRFNGFKLVAGFADHRGLLDLLRDDDVDAVILDHDLERTDGLALCLRIKQLDDPPAVVIYSGYAAPPIVLAATVAQADAIIHKAEPVSVLLDSLRRLTAGERLLGAPPPDLLETVATRLDAHDVPVMALLLDGASSPDIAEALALDVDEVRHRARRIVGLLQARSPEPDPS